MCDPDPTHQRHAAADLLRLIDGFKVSQAIHVAAMLGIADRIAAGLRDPDAIARAVGADCDAVYRLLRALAAHGVLCEEPGRRFSLSPMGECLRSDAGEALGPQAMLIGQPHYWQAWGGLFDSVRTGRNAFRTVHGMDTWTYRQCHPSEGAVFNAAMSANSRRIDRAIVGAVDFRSFESIVDIGGGQGALLAAIVGACPGVRGVLFDQPHVVAGAEAVLASAGIGGTCEVVGGNYFESLPEGCAAYVMKFVLHDWDDADAERILRVCRRAMRPASRLFVIERLLGALGTECAVTLSDLNMLVGPGGRERSQEEFAVLFTAAGLRLAGVVQTDAGVCVVEGVRA